MHLRSANWTIGFTIGRDLAFESAGSRSGRPFGRLYCPKAFGHQISPGRLSLGDRGGWTWDGTKAEGGTTGAPHLTGFEQTATGAGADVKLGTVFGTAGAATAGATVASSTGAFGASSEPSLNTTGSVDSCRFRGAGSTDSGASRFEASGAIGAKFVNETRAKR